MVDNPKLFEKYKLNNKVEVPSRLAAAPLSLYGSDPSGHLLDEERQYLAKRATGIGLYILGAAAVSLEGIGIMGQPRALSEKDIPFHLLLKEPKLLKIKELWLYVKLFMEDCSEISNILERHL